MVRTAAALAALVALAACTPDHPVDSTASAADATFTVQDVTRSAQASSLQVEVQVHTTSALTATRATYQATSGEQREASYEPGTMRAHADTTLHITIPGVETDGTLTIEGTGDTNHQGYQVKLRVGVQQEG